MTQALRIMAICYKRFIQWELLTATSFNLISFFFLSSKIATYICFILLKTFLATLVKRWNLLYVSFDWFMNVPISSQILLSAQCTRFSASKNRVTTSHVMSHTPGLALDNTYSTLVAKILEALPILRLQNFIQLLLQLFNHPTYDISNILSLFVNINTNICVVLFKV